MKARNGKIARLPHHIREELNVRLERSEQSPSLLAWLNAVPEVREFVQREFRGEPVSKQNLSQWRHGGFQDWLVRREFFANARNAGQFVAEREKRGEKALADQAAAVLAAQYAGLLLRWDGKCTKEVESRVRVLNGICRGVAELQRETRNASRENSGAGIPRGSSDHERSGQAELKSVAASHSDKNLGQSH